MAKPPVVGALSVGMVTAMRTAPEPSSQIQVTLGMPTSCSEAQVARAAERWAQARAMSVGASALASSTQMPSAEKTTWAASFSRETSVPSNWSDASAA